jgi:DUF917 family protein
VERFYKALKILTETNLEDYITGAGILGCGGGGDADDGRALIKDAFEKGFKFKLVNLNEIPDDELLCIIASVGGGVPKEMKERLVLYSQKLKGTKEEMIFLLQKAARELSNYMDKGFYSYIAAETGPKNGIVPMYVAALEGKPCIDGDCCGRAKPELALSLTNVAGIPITPISMVTNFNENLILMNAIDDYRAEDICRYAAIASGGWITVARCPATVKTYRSGVIQNQVTKCINIGEVIRTSLSEGNNPIDAFIREVNARKLFEGTVLSHEIEGKEGFNWGNWYIKGNDKFKDHSLRVWFKNEHLISWLDDEPCVVCPDLICIVDSETCHGLSNFVESGENDGKSVTVLGLKAHKAWRTERGRQIFSPKHFGYDIEYS